MTTTLPRGVRRLAVWLEAGALAGKCDIVCALIAWSQARARWAMLSGGDPRPYLDLAEAALNALGRAER